MSQLSARLKGWKRIISAVIIVVIVAFALTVRTRTIRADAVELIRTQLATDYSQQLMPTLQETAQEPAVSESQVSDITEKLSRDHIDIVAVDARRRSGSVFVKVEIEVDGSEPPDGRRIRYYEVAHSRVDGWTVEREVPRWRYFLAL